MLQLPSQSLRSWVPLKNHLGDIFDTHHILNNRWREQEEMDQSCAPERRHEQSPCPNRLGPHAFGRAIRKVHFPTKVHAPANITKYDGTTNLSVWLEDYCLACCMAGIKNDHLIIQFLPIHLAEGTRAWLKHLSSGTIHDWVNLKKVFVGDFQGTYKQPGSS